MRRHSPLFLLRLNESREITIAGCRGRGRSDGLGCVSVATLTLVYVRVKKARSGRERKVVNKFRGQSIEGMKCEIYLSQLDSRTYE